MQQQRLMMAKTLITRLFTVAKPSRQLSFSKKISTRYCVPTMSDGERTNERLTIWQGEITKNLAKSPTVSCKLT
jgi:hypothetical protein